MKKTIKKQSKSKVVKKITTKSKPNKVTSKKTKKVDNNKTKNVVKSKNTIKPRTIIDVKEIPASKPIVSLKDIPMPKTIANANAVDIIKTAPKPKTTLKSDEIVEPKKTTKSKKNVKQKISSKTVKAIEHTEIIDNNKSSETEFDIKLETTIEPDVDFKPEIVEESEIEPLDNAQEDSKDDVKNEYFDYEYQKELDRLSSRYEKTKYSKYVKRIIFAALVIIATTIFVVKYKNDNLENMEYVPVSYDTDRTYQNIWLENQNKAYVKEDYVGQIIFESGLINEPIVQGESNDTYLRRNYETYKYDICGPVFMDSACKRRGDQNTVLYGHNRSVSVDSNQEMKFTPLHILEDQNNYEDNKLIYMVYENSVDVFMISHIYKVKVEEDNQGNQYIKDGEPEYYLNKYSDNEFKDYLKAIEKREYYDTGVIVSKEDTLLTLQTCFENSIDKLIVVAKKIDTKEFD